MASTGSRVVSAAIGAFLAQVATWGVQQGSAAWGWQLSVPDNAGFSCAEGESVGCSGMPPDCGDLGGCCTSNYTCTVVAPDGYTCDTDTVMVECKLDGEDDWMQPTSTLAANGEEAVTGQPACINEGSDEDNHTKNAELRWSATVTCSADDDETGTSSAQGRTTPVFLGAFLAVTVAVTPIR